MRRVILTIDQARDLEDEGEKIQVGRTYELNAPGEENHLVFVVLAECDATWRWWKILVLQSGPWWFDVKPGAVCEWRRMKGAKIFTRVKRVD